MVAERSELGVNPHPENGNIFQADPVALMRDNPAALIVNRESYARMAGRFTYGPNGQFESPQVVRVRTFSSGHEEVIKIFVLDGLTRTKFVYDNRGNPAVIPADFQFTVRDVTSSVLQNPAYVADGEAVEGQQSLTMLQYLRAVIPPTVEHTQIASDRIAAHLINAWENQVGTELAERFSAIAALNFIANPEVPTATDDLLKSFLERQNELMAARAGNETETVKDRVILQQALREIAAVIRQTRLHKKEVARSAFMLVSTASPVIGGEKEARKQVYGLLYAPSVERKLADAFPIYEEREQMRIQLAKSILDAFGRFSHAPNRDQIINEVLGRALTDQHLSFAQLTEVFQAPDPTTTFDQSRRLNNRNRLSTHYQATSGRQELSATEESFIDRFGRVSILQEGELARITSRIREVNSALELADSVVAQLTNNHDNMIQGGARSDTLGEAIVAIGSFRQELLDVTALNSVPGKIQKLRDAKTEIERRITRQIAVYNAGKIVDEVYGASLKSPAGARLRREISFYLLRESDINDHDLLKTILTRLKGLDPDLQNQVIEGQVRLNRAIQIHQERRRSTVEPKAPDQKPVSVPPAPEPASVRPQVAALPAEAQEREQAEKRRIAFNNDKLRLGANSFLMDTLMSLDLDSNDLTAETRRVVDKMLQAIGKIRFNHPDIVRLIEGSPQKDAEIRRLREVIVNLDQEIASRDARTGR